MVVYMITNRVNTKSYVGYTSRTLEERWKEHIAESKKNRSSISKFYRALRKYDQNSWHIEVLAKAESTEHALELEREYIKKLNTWKDGYNSNAGGRGARLSGASYDRFLEAMRSPEVRSKLSKAHKGKKVPKSKEWREKVSQAVSGENNHMYGKKRTLDAIKRGAIKHRKQIRCLQNNILYGSVKEASEALGLNSGAICKTLKGKWKHTKGYSFRYEVQNG